MAYEQMAFHNAQILETDEFEKEPIINDITLPPTSQSIPQQTPNSTPQYVNLFEQPDRGLEPPSFQILEDLQGEEINKYIFNNFEFFMNAVLSFLMPLRQGDTPEFDYESVVSKLKVNNPIAWSILNDHYINLQRQQQQQERRAYLMARPPVYTPQPLAQATYAGGKAKKIKKSKK